MKRYTALALTLALILSTACNSGVTGNEHAEVTTTVATETTTPETTTVAETTTVVVTTTEPPATTAEEITETVTEGTTAETTTVTENPVTTAKPVTTAPPLKPVDPKYKLNVYCNNGFEISPKLRNEIESTIAANPHKNGFYVQTYDTTLAFGYNENAEFDGTNMATLGYAAFGTYELLRGNGDPNEKIIYKEEHYTDGPGLFKTFMKYGNSVTIQSLIYSSAIGDHIALNMLKSQYSVASYNSWVSSIGCSETKLTKNGEVSATTPKDSVIIWSEFQYDKNEVADMLRSTLAWNDMGLAYKKYKTGGYRFGETYPGDGDKIACFSATAWHNANQQDQRFFEISIISDGNTEQDKQFTFKMADLTDKVLDEYYAYCKKNNIKIE